jgi:hypothetical protein
MIARRHLLTWMYAPWQGAPPLAPRTGITFYENFEGASAFAAQHMQGSTAYAFTQITSPALEGAKAGRWELQKGDAEASGGCRTECLFTEALAQAETWHGFAAYFPSADYADDSISYDIINQWHQGSSWGSPMLLIRVKNGQLYLNRRSNTSSSIEYALGAQPKDRWVKFVIHLRQDTAAGFMKIWIDGALVLDITGETKFPDTNGRWKMGIYKSDWNNGGTYKPTNSTRRVWYVDEVRIGDSSSNYASVFPSGLT